MMQRDETGGKKGPNVVQSGCTVEVRAILVQKPFNE
jgi:hypothetical protein